MAESRPISFESRQECADFDDDELTRHAGELFRWIVQRMHSQPEMGCLVNRAIEINKLGRDALVTWLEAEAKARRQPGTVRQPRY